MTRVYDYCIVKPMTKIEYIHNFMWYTNCDSKNFLDSDDIYYKYIYVTLLSN